jgi:alpha-L-fucosidase 2
MRFKQGVYVALLLVLFGVEAMAVQPNRHLLWYDQPARLWVEALPLGNGRLGAMVYGNPANEQIQLNEETIWAGQPNNNANPLALENIPKVRELVFAGKYLEAQTLATEKVMSQTNHGMPYQTFGDLRIAFPGHSEYAAYYRELDIDSAIARVTYKQGKVTFRREYLTSFTDQVVMIRLTASKKKQISFNAILTSPQQDVDIRSEGNEITLQGITSTHERLRGLVRFHGRVAVKTRGGKVISKDGVLSVEKADEAILYVSIGTNFNHYRDISGDPVARAKEKLEAALTKSWPEVRKSHIAFYQSFYNRSSLSLGADKSGLPTDKRVETFAQTHDKHLVALYYQFGRYLLICSSQPGGQPANLQGIWNDKMLPPWDSKYTCNINAQMNYWPAEVTNLSELHEPMIQLIREVSESGRETAKVMYDANGWVLHHNTDIWRITGPVDRAPSGMWPSGGAWLTRHLWERFLHTGDLKFLREVYPIIRGSAEFFDEVMVREPEHNWLVVCPSNSPENTHAGSNNKSTTAGGVTMDNQLIFDLWNAVITASELLNTDHAFAAKLKAKLKEMPPMQIGRWGQLQEWMHDWDSPNDKHRHVSHLYGLFPSNQISAFRTPELFDAARTSLIARGDPSTGWSMGWKVCLWARLLDGDHAYKLITDQLTLVREQPKMGGTYPNLFDAHPPFQIDGNFGCTAGIVEMLMQSHDGFVHLLPALPSVWPDGEVKGIVARGGFVLDIRWEKGEVKEVKVLSRFGGNLRLKSHSPLQAAGLAAAKGDNPNKLFEVPQVPAPLINAAARLNPVVTRGFNLYDLPTEAGKTYIISKR